MLGDKITAIFMCTYISLPCACRLSGVSFDKSDVEAVIASNLKTVSIATQGMKVSQPAHCQHGS